MSDELKIKRWLSICCFMVFAMAVVGAITRLTESGLSMVEWRPLIGMIPPIGAQEWQRVFDLYRESPEYRIHNSWMTISDFRTIFYWEWGHRLLARMIGFAYAVPFAWFMYFRQIPKGYGLKLTGILLLGVLQGGIGWWMVQSGLVERPDVSHYRLAVHLVMALLIFSAMWWVILDIETGKWTQKQAKVQTKMKVPLGILWHGRLALCLLSVTILWGAFVAGLDAGKIYNNFPMMTGKVYENVFSMTDKSFLPYEEWSLMAHVESHGWVQFTHRWIAILAALVIFSLGSKLQISYLRFAVSFQVVLGIGTLLLQAWLPLAALHQATAIIVLALLLRAIHDPKVYDTN